MKLKNIVAFATLAIIGLSSLGCSQSADNTAPAAPAAGQVSEAAHSQDGWWCGEHGMPEEVCAQCDSKVAAELKNMGDWCKEHDRPDSQCFVCHPELAQKFAALYEAKYGKAPPARGDAQVD